MRAVTADLVISVTDHKDVDYARVVKLAPLILDTRGVVRESDGKVVSLSGAVNRQRCRPPTRSGGCRWRATAP